MPNNQENGNNPYDAELPLEALPEHVISTMEVRDRWFTRSAPPPEHGEAFVVEDLLRWEPGQTVRVAFLGGDTDLHADIAEATREITEACNIKLDFERYGCDLESRRLDSRFERRSDPANFFWGKVSTLVQVIGISLVLFAAVTGYTIFLPTTYFIIVVLVVISGVHYIFQVASLMKKEEQTSS